MSLSSIFPSVSPDERSRLAFGAAAFMFAASAGVVARTAGSALFLSQFAPSALAYVYIASAALLMVASFSFGWLSSRLPLMVLLPATAAVLAVAALLLRNALLTPWRGFAVAAYLYSDLVGKLPALLFWSVAATMFNPRQGKRLFVLIGAAGTVACVVAGTLVAPFAKRLGTSNLLLVVGLQLLAFGAVMWWWMAPSESTSRPPETRRGRSGAGLRYYAELVALPQVRHIAAVAVIGTLGLLLTDYLFKSAARAHYVGADLAAFFGVFYAASSFSALFVQLFFAHAILRRGGVLAAAAILPGSLLLLSVGSALTGSFGFAIAAKFVDPVFDFTLNAAAIQLLYLGIRKQSRTQARTLIEGTARPAAVALGGLLLAGAAARLAPQTIAAIVAIGAALWLVESWLSYRSYVGGLLESIGVRRFDPADEGIGIGDPTVETHIRAALETASDDELLYLLGVIAQFDDADWRAEFRRLLSRDQPQIKVAAIDYLREHGEREDAAAIRPELDHGSPAVRAAAVHALAKLARADCSPDVMRLLDDPEPEVRAAATAELINVGDLDALLAACIGLKSMLRSDDREARAAAARALSRVTNAGLSRVLVELLDDPHDEVQRAALSACAERPDPVLIPAVIRLLAHPDLGVAACDTLAVFGPAVVSHFASFPEDSRRPYRNELLLVPQVLAGTRHPSALPLLEGALDCPDVRLRTAVIGAYCDLVGTLPVAERPLATMKRTALREIANSQERASLVRLLASIQNARLLRQVLEEERLELLGNAFHLMATIHPKVDLRSLFWVMRGGTAEKRAEALEVLDNVLDAELKAAVLGVFEPAASTSPAGAAPDARQIATLLSEVHSEWVVASAAYTTGRDQVTSCLAAVRELLNSDSPYVREAALDAWSRLAEPAEVLSVARKISRDSSLGVRSLAQRIMAEARP